MLETVLWRDGDDVYDSLFQLLGVTTWNNLSSASGWQRWWNEEECIYECQIYAYYFWQQLTILQKICLETFIHMSWLNNGVTWSWYLAWKIILASAFMMDWSRWHWFLLRTRQCCISIIIKTGDD